MHLTSELAYPTIYFRFRIGVSKKKHYLCTTDYYISIALKRPGCPSGCWDVLFVFLLSFGRHIEKSYICFWNRLKTPYFCISVAGLLLGNFLLLKNNVLWCSISVGYEWEMFCTLHSASESKADLASNKLCQLNAKRWQKYYWIPVFRKNTRILVFLFSFCIVCYFFCCYFVAWNKMSNKSNKYEQQGIYQATKA